MILRNMSQTQESMIIDASGKSLGRVASRAAVLLMGKHLPEYQSNRTFGKSLTITHVDDLQIKEIKLKTKNYLSYSGYPGGQKSKSMAITKNAKGTAELLRLAIYGMLPPNRLRAIRMARLNIQ